MRKVRVVDSHTAGEPTRVVIENAPVLSGTTMAQRRNHFARHCDDFRTGAVLEPRGWDALVGAVMTPPTSPDSLCGAIFFNNVGVLNMCGHAMMGLAVTLAHVGRIAAGVYSIDTSAGTVRFELEPDLQHVRMRNVAARRLLTDVSLTLPDGHVVTGDVAWGGNWFFLARRHRADLDRWKVGQLLDYTKRIRAALDASAMRGDDGGTIDHVELFGPSPTADSRNFVLCPGGQWDRSPCGTGTSAKIACLAADGTLAAGQVWRQQSIIGSQFEASYQLDEAGNVIPILRGAAYVTGTAELLFHADDPFRRGIRVFGANSASKS